MRGEYRQSSRRRPSCVELPPRARRIHAGSLGSRGVDGTTSACAENTASWTRPVPAMGNYLRVRGEYSFSPHWLRFFRELPPRARRIPITGEHKPYAVGTTSACAENTVCRASLSCGLWNYLRVRGEYLSRLRTLPTHWELPPRARRIQVGDNQPITVLGTTSACAENTASAHYQVETDGNYLRVRGEYRLRFKADTNILELPPRARRILMGKVNEL